MKVLTIDIETRSDVDITKSGLYKYAESPDFRILLVSVSVDGGDVKTYDIASGDKLPKHIIEAFFDNRVVKRAFNVNFERVCLSVYTKKIILLFLIQQAVTYPLKAGIAIWYMPVILECHLHLNSSERFCI